MKNRWVPPNHGYEEWIGEGEQATVLLCRDLGTGELVSVKSEPNEIRDAGFGSRITNEFLFLTRHAHPGLPVPCTVGRDEFRVYYTYQHLTGTAIGCASWSGAVEEFDKIAAGLLGALAVIHDTGTLHHDVSPENVIIQDAGPLASCVLIDFGLSGPSDDRARGTMGYIAPELLSGGRGTRGSDVYAACLVLAEFTLGRRLLLGRSPRQARSTQEGLVKKISGELAGRLGAERGELLIRGLTADLARREHDCLSLLTDLNALSAGLLSPMVGATAQATLRSVTKLDRNDSQAICQALGPADCRVGPGSDPLLTVVNVPEGSRIATQALISCELMKRVAGLRLVRDRERGEVVGISVLGPGTESNVEMGTLEGARVGAQDFVVLADCAGSVNTVRIAVSEQSLEKLTADLVGSKWERGSAGTIARVIYEERHSVLFSQSKMIRVLAEQGSIRRKAGNWICAQIDDDVALLGLRSERVESELAQLNEDQVVGLELLAVASRYPNRTLDRYVSRDREDVLESISNALVVKDKMSALFKIPGNALVSYLWGRVGTARREGLHALLASQLSGSVQEQRESECAYHQLHSSMKEARCTQDGLLSALERGAIRECIALMDGLKSRVAKGEEIDDRVRILWVWALIECDRNSEALALIRTFGTRYRDYEAEWMRRLLDAGSQAFETAPTVGWANVFELVKRGEEELGRDQVEALETILVDMLKMYAGGFQISENGSSCGGVSLVTYGERYAMLSIVDSLAKAHWKRSRLGKALDVFSSGEALASALSMKIWAAKFEANCANCLMKGGESGAARAKLRKVSSDRESRGDLLGASKAIGNIAVSLFREGRVSEALSSWMRERELVTLAGDSRRAASTAGKIASAFSEVGNWDQAKREYESAISLSRACRDEGSESVLRVNLCSLLYWEGDLSGAVLQLSMLRLLDENCAQSGVVREKIKYWSERLGQDLGDSVLEGEGASHEAVLDAAEAISAGLDCPSSELVLERGLRGILRQGRHCLGRLESFGSLGPGRCDLLGLLASRIIQDWKSGGEIVLEASKEFPKVPFGAEQVAFCDGCLDFLCEMQIEGERSPGRSVEEVFRVVADSGLQGLAWKAHLALGLKLNRRGDGKGSLKNLIVAFQLCSRQRSMGNENGARQLYEEMGKSLSSVSSDEGEAPSDYVGISKLLLRLSVSAMEGDGVVTSQGGRGVEEILNVTRSLNSRKSVDELLSEIIGCVMGLCDAENGFVVLFNDAGTADVRVARGAHDGPIEGRGELISQSVVRRAVSTKESVLIKSALDDEGLVDKPSIRQLSLRSILCTPLLLSGNVLGVMYLDNRSAEGSFSEEDRSLLEVFAGQAAVSIRNNRLFNDLERSYVALADAHERIVRSDRMKLLGEMAGGVAHDFNNLLTMILVRSQYLQGQCENEEVVRELKLIEKAAMDGGSAIRRIQEYSRVHRRRDLAIFDLGEAVADVIEFTRNRWESRGAGGGCTVVFERERGVDAIGNVSEIREVFTNIVINGIEAMPTGGNVRIKICRGSGKRVGVMFSDEGCGIPEEMVSSVFDPFFTTKGERGNGLGLSVAYGIVSRHGGEIEVVSEVGVGTAFTVWLPVE